jgi:hypothetical protein
MITAIDALRRPYTPGAGSTAHTARRGADYACYPDESPLPSDLTPEVSLGSIARPDSA